MKKWAFVAIGLILAGVAYYVARRQVMVPLWAQPKTGKVVRGDIKVPITAAGLIRANQVVEVKSEASGRITEVPVAEGSFVHAGTPVVILDPQDEERAVERAKADFDRASAMLEQARVAVERARVAIDSAKAGLEEITAQGDIVAFELAKIERTLAQGKSDLYSDQQVNDIRAQHRMSLAQQATARIAVTSAELSQKDAEAAVQSQEAVVQATKKTLEDAQKRRKETTVIARQDAIVTEVYVRPGMLVQSATQGFTGGTPLMSLADVSRKKVIARLDEADYGRVLAISPIEALPEMPELREAAQQDAEQLEKRSGTVRITVDAFPDDEFEGRIERVEPQGKLNVGSSIIQFDVHVWITDPKRHKLPLGAQAQVEFTVESAVSALLVPAEAVKTFEAQRGVWVKVPPERGSQEEFGKRFVACRFGISDGERTELLAPFDEGELKEGTEVYTKLPQEAGGGGD
jgi:multidrug efflux pump subunit AcrA (membrane-fusion protein)